MRVPNSLFVLFLSLGIFLVSPSKANPSVIKAEGLKAHNIVRIKHRQRPFVWSEDLAKISQQWADKLGKSCKMAHHQGELPFGENLFISSVPTSINSAVKVWADEEGIYDYKNNKCTSAKECKHFTQIVWKGTTDVGCGTARCSNNSQIWVCGYFPAGNVVGARPY